MEKEGIDLLKVYLVIRITVKLSLIPIRVQSNWDFDGMGIG